MKIRHVPNKSAREGRTTQCEQASCQPQIHPCGQRKHTGIAQRDECAWTQSTPSAGPSAGSAWGAVVCGCHRIPLRIALNSALPKSRRCISTRLMAYTERLHNVFYADPSVESAIVNIVRPVHPSLRNRCACDPDVQSSVTSKATPLTN